MTDLDLSAEMRRIAEEVRRRHRETGDPQAVAIANMALAAATEIERLRGEVFTLTNSEALEVADANAEIRKLRAAVGNFPSSEAYESAMQALSDARSANDRMYSLLLEILSNFHETGRAGAGEFRYEAVRSGWVRAETFERWRSLAGGRDV